MSRWHKLEGDLAVRLAVASMVQVFALHEPFLRSVILISAMHPEVQRRGSALAREMSDRFVDVLLKIRAEIDHPDPDAALRHAFDAAFSALVIRTSYGPGFIGVAVDEDTFVRELSSMVSSYLLRSAGSASLDAR